MKRYNMIVALLALMTFTGCKLGDGTDPNPDKSKQIIWSCVYDDIYSGYHHSLFAIYGEALLNDNQALAERAKQMLDLPETISVAVEEERIVLTKSNGLNPTIYTIVTKGKKLSEGAVWVLSYSTANSSDRTLATFTGKEGSDSAFAISRRDSEGPINGDITYTYTAEDQKLAVSLNCTGEIEKVGAKITFVVQPQKLFVFTNHSSVVGAVDILYKDTDRGTTKSFTAEVVSDFSNMHDIIYDNVVYKEN